jgi:predicted DNA-binding WGR domain protein
MQLDLKITCDDPAPSALGKATRYYQVDICQDLWGQWVLIQRWGRRGTALGQTRRVPCGYADALNLLARIQRRRFQRGYCAVVDLL